MSSTVTDTQIPTWAPEARRFLYERVLVETGHERAGLLIGAPGSASERPRITALVPMEEVGAGVREHPRGAVIGWYVTRPDGLNVDPDKLAWPGGRMPEGGSLVAVFDTFSGSAALYRRQGDQLVLLRRGRLRESGAPATGRAGRGSRTGLARPAIILGVLLAIALWLSPTANHHGRSPRATSIEGRHHAGRLAPVRALPVEVTSINRMVGMKIVTPMSGTHPSRGLLRRVRRGEVGGVILFRDNLRDSHGIAAAARSLQRAARAGHGLPLPIFVDQEGGTVRRLPWAPPTLPARDMGAAGPRVSRAQGAATGRALRRVGIGVDLAPVADTARPGGGFLGSRAFGTSPSQVARSACAFAGGLRAADVSPVLKHFPGLGMSETSTDVAPVVVRASARRLRAGYLAYEQCPSGVVMVSNASYPRLDPSGLPGVLSRRIVQGELRGRLHFSGVVVSDALEAPGPSRFRRVSTLAANAGVDLLLWGPGRESEARDAYRDLLRAAATGRLDRGELNASAHRIAVWRQRLAHPGPGLDG